MARAKKHSIATLAALVAFVLLSILFIAVALTLQSDTRPLTTATRAAENCSDWCATSSQCSNAGGTQVASACSFEFCAAGTAPCLVGGRPEKSATCSAGKWKGEYCERTATGFGTPPYCVRVDWNASCGDSYTRDDGLNCCSDGGSGGGAAASGGSSGGQNPPQTQPGTGQTAQPTARPTNANIPFNAQTTVILPTSTRTPTPTVTPAARCTNAAPYQTYQQCLFNCGAGAGNCTQQGACYKCTMPTATPRPTTAQAQGIITQPVAFNTAVPQQQQPTQVQTQPTSGSGGQASADTCPAPSACTTGLAGGGSPDFINGQALPDTICPGGQEEFTGGRAYCSQQKGPSGVCCRARTTASYDKPFTLINSYTTNKIRIIQVNMRAETGLGNLGFNDFVGYAHTMNPGARYTYLNVNDICKKPGNSQATVLIEVQYRVEIPGDDVTYLRKVRTSCAQGKLGLTFNLDPTK